MSVYDNEDCGTEVGGVNCAETDSDEGSVCADTAISGNKCTEVSVSKSNSADLDT